MNHKSEITPFPETVYLTVIPRKSGQTTIPRRIFHQTSWEKAMVNNQPANQKTPPKLAAPAPPLPEFMFLLL